MLIIVRRRYYFTTGHKMKLDLGYDKYYIGEVTEVEKNASHSLHRHRDICSGQRKFHLKMLNKISSSAIISKPISVIFIKFIESNTVEKLSSLSKLRCMNY